MARIIGLVLLGLAGWGVSAMFTDATLSLLLSGLGGAIIGGIAAPFPARIFQRWLNREMARIPAQTFISGLVGVVAALVVGGLLSLPLSLLPGMAGKIAPAVAVLVLLYMGVTVMTAHSRTVAGIIGMGGGPRTHGQLNAEDSPRALLDTSTIIDGRIADIARAGFAPGILVIPKFVLEELQYIADSSDSLRRQRGRRGLEMLNKLQKEAAVPVEISDTDFKEADGVDSKLVLMARATGYPVVTNDFGLNRVAELQGVRVLNINLLATAVKPLILPGEEVDIRVIQEGKEFGQGVGFLDDGTMVVIEDGRRHLNNRVGVVVTRVLQTAVGRMIFAQVKNGASHDRTPKS
ncbi:MAG: PIN domain nuclease [Dehalococcoidia bacterium]|nr:PIN domain nuclease [Dehalococcoidia bacterium]